MAGELVGLRGVAGVLPESSLDLQELQQRSLIRSNPQTLADFGFERAHIAQPGESPQLALKAAREALADAQLEASQIDLLIWASALPQNHLIPTEDQSVLKNFQYAAGWLQQELHLTNSEVMAVTQQGCATMFSALRAARSLIVADPRVNNVLCVGVDVLPAGATREIMYNVISDAACAVVVSRDWPRDRWLGYRQISHGYYWDTIGKQAEIIAAYFPTSHALMGELLEGCDLAPSDVDVVVPTNVNRKSWEILLRLVGIDSTRLYRGESFGHTIAADNFLILNGLRSRKDVREGAKMMLFTYGFGSTWSGLMLEH